MKLTELNPVPSSVVELFTKYPELWTKGRGSCGLFTSDGGAVDTFQEAEKLCLGSAIGFVVREGGMYDGKLHDGPIGEMSRSVLRIINARRTRNREYLFITDWNDEEGRTVEQVINIAKEACI